MVGRLRLVSLVHSFPLRAIPLLPSQCSAVIGSSFSPSHDSAHHQFHFRSQTRMSEFWQIAVVDDCVDCSYRFYFKSGKASDPSVCLFVLRLANTCKSDHWRAVSSKWCNLLWLKLAVMKSSRANHNVHCSINFIDALDHLLSSLAATSRSQESPFCFSLFRCYCAFPITGHPLPSFIFFLNEFCFLTTNSNVWVLSKACFNRIFCKHIKYMVRCTEYSSASFTFC